MSHPLDDVEFTPWGKRVTKYVDALEQSEAKEKSMEAEKQPANGRNGTWRISKEIPITVVSFLVLQTISFTWFMAGLNSGLNGVIKDNADNKATSYTRDDARKERELMDQKLLFIQSKEEEITRRTALVESAVNELKARLPIK